jgi:hypothetical protein
MIKRPETNKTDDWANCQFSTIGYMHKVLLAGRENPITLHLRLIVFYRTTKAMLKVPY